MRTYLLVKIYIAIRITLMKISKTRSTMYRNLTLFVNMPLTSSIVSSPFTTRSQKATNYSLRQKRNKKNKTKVAMKRNRQSRMRRQTKRSQFKMTRARKTTIPTAANRKKAATF